MTCLELFPVLRRMRSLCSLVLSDCDLSDGSGVELADIVPRFRRASVDLSHNTLSDTTATALTLSLRCRDAVTGVHDVEPYF